MAFPVPAPSKPAGCSWLPSIPWATSLSTSTTTQCQQLPTPTKPRARHSWPRGGTPEVAPPWPSRPPRIWCPSSAGSWCTWRSRPASVAVRAFPPAPAGGSAPGPTTAASPSAAAAATTCNIGGSSEPASARSSGAAWSSARSAWKRRRSTCASDAYLVDFVAWHPLLVFSSSDEVETNKKKNKN